MSLSNPTINESLGRGKNPIIPFNGIGKFYDKIETLGEKSGFSLKHGRVVDIWTLQAVAIVQCSGCNLIKCPITINSSGKVTGVSEVFVPTIGDFVLLCKKDGAETGLIICAFPSWATTSMADVHTVDELEQKSIQLTDAKSYKMDKVIFPGNQIGPHFADFLPGEKYALNENLVGYILTKYFMKIQAGDLCSATFDYLDGMLNAFLHNLRIFNSGFFLESICDFGRTNTELHLSAHLNDFAVEKEEDRRTNSIIRLFSGWLSAGAHIYSQNKNGEGEPGSDIWIDELGTVSLRSNTTCFMHKVDGIYVPIRKFRADHPNKKEADHSIDEKKQREAFQLNPNAPHEMAFGCAARDYVAYLMGSKYQFERYNPYKKDWEKLSVTKSKGNPPEISGFNGKYGDIYTIEAQKEERDGDKNETRVGEAFCGVLPDGSVLLRDAWGSQVELRGGRVVISGANDIEVTSGRDVVITAGKDAIIKAKDNCEMVALEKSIRVRSNKLLEIESSNSAVQITAPKMSGIKTDGKGEKYSVAGILLKSDEIEMVGKKFQANLDTMFYIQGQSHGSPPYFIVRSQNNLFWDNGTFFKNGDEDSYAAIIDGNLMGTGGVFVEGWGISYEGVATDGLVAAIDGGIYTNGNFVGTPPGGPPDPPMEPLDPLELVEKMETAYKIEDWDEKWRLPYKKEDYERIKYKHRTTEEYRTESAKWFEKFWQRQFKDSLEPMSFSDDKDDDGENSYPGKKHIDGGEKGFIMYDEVNVQQDGSPKLPDEQKKEGGTFTSVPYAAQLFKK